MSRSCSLRAAVSTALLLLSAEALSAEKEVLDDAWMKILLGEDHVGWVHLVVEREGEVVTTSSEEYMKLGRYGSQVEVRVTRAFVETRLGYPISFQQEMLMSASPRKLVGRIEDGKLVLSTTVMGRSRSVELDWKEGAVLEWGAELKERAILKPGGKVTYDTFNAEVGRFVEVEAEYLGREKVELPSGTRELHKCRVKGFIPGISSEEYRDDSGAVWKAITQAMGMRIEMIRCGEKEARAVSGADITPDFMIACNVRLMQPRRVEEAVYEFKAPKDEQKLDFGGQEVLSRRGGAVVLRVSASPPPEAVPLPVVAPGMEKYLADTSILSAADPLIVKLAREAAGSEKDAVQAALKLEKWVHRNITSKGFGVGFADALEVARNRAGDCSEHAVLLCALARALGIPSRAAAGIIYWEAMGPKTFGWHLWTEVFVGEWVALDATLGVGKSDATHIKFAESAFEEGRGMGEIAEGLVGILGTFKVVEVKEYRVGGMRVVPGEKHTEWRIEGRRYIDAVNCFSLEIPKGWKVFLRGTGMLRKWSAAVELAPGKGAFLLRVTSTRNPPGGRVRDMLRDLKRKAAVREVSWSTVDGEEAATTRYTRGGEEREAVMVVDDDVRHVIRLSPWSLEGSRALEEVAQSFRFVGKAGR